jgi:gamma-glutamylcyclotransferase
MKRYYFAYGMNTNIAEMTMRCPKAINLGRCTLQGFELKFRHHADIDKVDGSEMEGVLWDITEDCERALDRLEGYPYYYDKVEVIVIPDHPVNKNTRILAMAYIMTSKGIEHPPSTSYEDCLIEGYTANGLDVDKLTIKIDSLTIA